MRARRSAALSGLKITGIDRPESLTEHVYRRLKKAIRSGLLVPERFYPLGDIAAQFGISRTPVREAILKLEHEGLVEIVPQRGFRIRHVPPDEASEVFDLRSLIEGRAIEKLAQQAGPAEIRTLRSILDRQSRAVTDTARFLDIDEEFHLKMIELAGLRRARDFLVQLRDIVWLLGLEAVTHPGRAAEVLAEHRRMVDSIEKRDRLRARRAADAHLQSTRETILSAATRPPRKAENR